MQKHDKINAGPAENQDKKRSAAAPGTIINRREIEPLLQKAEKILKSYEQATGSAVSILDSEGCAVNRVDYKGAAFFCSLYERFHQNQEKEKEEDVHPCACIHLKETAGLRRTRGSCIYMCKMGFVYWMSPIHSGGRFAGSLVAGRVLGIERGRAAKNIYQLCQGAVPEYRILEYLDYIPEKTLEEIRAQARLLQICAKRISGKAAENERYSDKNTKPETDRPAAKTEEDKIVLAGKRVSSEVSGRERFLDRERLLLASLRRGDKKPAMKILNEIVRNLFVSDSVETLRLWAIELVVSLSRANPKKAAETETLEANGRYIKWIEDSKTVDELAENLRVIIERMAGNIFYFQGIRHSSALRKAERFIWENYTHKISLREIAEASGLSAPYFSTIFKEEMGENLSNYLNRLRIEKAAAMLTETDKTLSEIADECGFEDQSWFSKIFKHYIGISPGKYRETGGNETGSLFSIGLEDADRETDNLACYAG